jgi:hypothetical protein
VTHEGNDDVGSLVSQVWRITGIVSDSTEIPQKNISFIIHIEDAVNMRFFEIQEA